MQQQKSFDMSSRRLMVGLPAYDHKVSIKMAIALVHFGQKCVEHGVELRIASICGCSVVSRARNMIVDEFLNSPCTDLLFIDSDINFDANDVFRLLAWGVHHDIVGGVPVARKAGQTYIASFEDGGDGEVIMDSMGNVRMKRLATAFMLIQRRVFEALGAAHPEWDYAEDKKDGKIMKSYFDFKSTREGYVGEDFLFCDRAREAGFEVWVDPTIKLGHMGVAEYTSAFGEELLYPMLRPLTQEVA
jgi:hypothetical protein